MKSWDLSSSFFSHDSKIIVAVQVLKLKGVAVIYLK
jgi:hypothetical protein